MDRIRVPFGALVLAQAAHSIEEYVGRLWESFPPAAFLTGLVSSDREVGFLVINIGLVAFGVWCFLWPVSRGWRSGTAVAWFWVIMETINGIGHAVWSVRQGRYTPGEFTTPMLFALAIIVAVQLLTRPRIRLTERVARPG